eukprot:m.91234 g.91234  ORF g.91234 m.91234 type:complete len:97 (+) comp51131_c0_seq4:447-737(+)
MLFLFFFLGCVCSVCLLCMCVCVQAAETDPLQALRALIARALVDQTATTEASTSTDTSASASALASSTSSSLTEAVDPSRLIADALRRKFAAEASP